VGYLQWLEGIKRSQDFYHGNIVGAGSPKALGGGYSNNKWGGKLSKSQFVLCQGNFSRKFMFFAIVPTPY
jgi:hypothetical protein